LSDYPTCVDLETIIVTPNRTEEGYPLKVYLSPEAIAFLESRYPNLDPELGIVHLVEEAMERAKRTARARVQVWEHPTLNQPKAVPQPPFTPPNLTPQQQVVPPDPSLSLSNPVGALQQYCQQNYLPLPEYRLRIAIEKFWSLRLKNRQNKDFSDHLDLALNGLNCPTINCI
jgi:hypothetical protein